MQLATTLTPVNQPLYMLRKPASLNPTLHGRFNDIGGSSTMH
jgi:hypothetical protein